MRVGILFGGKSGEHEISILSAKSISKAIDRSKHEVVMIGIDKEGRFLLSDENCTIFRGRPFLEVCGELLKGLDVVFPVLHGPFGEDGTIQGMLELAEIPYVGASVLGSAIGLDKDVTKRLAREANVRVTEFIACKKKQDFDEVVQQLGLPFFVKPATMGSSLGVTKVFSREEFDAALDLAFSFDRKILLEKAVVGREIECAVLGLDEPIASLPGEIIPKGGVYTYENKYLDPEGASFAIPAPLSEEKCKEVQNTSLKVFDLLACEGMARVDFFMDHEGLLYLNEINTIPGFTSISLYPKMWEASHMSYTALVEHLLQIAIKRSNTTCLLS